MSNLAKKAWRVKKAKDKLAKRLANRMCVCGHKYLIHRKNVCFESFKMHPEGIKCTCPGFLDAAKYELRKKVQI
jgi:hypothetical protein